MQTPSSLTPFPSREDQSQRGRIRGSGKNQGSATGWGFLSGASGKESTY